MKFIITFFLMFSFCIGFSKDLKINDAKYEILNDGVAILKEYKNATGDIVIPQEIENPKTGERYVVKEIAKNAFKGQPLTSISLPPTVTLIGKSAFNKCTNLKTVKAPGVEIIESGGFNNCTSLNEIQFPNIKDIGRRAFVKCGFTSIDFPSSLKLIGISAFWECDKLSKITFHEADDTIIIEELAFKGVPVSQLKLGKKIKKQTDDHFFFNVEESQYKSKISPNYCFDGDNLKELTIGKQYKNFPNEIFPYKYVENLKAYRPTKVYYEVNSLDDYDYIKKLCDNRIPYTFIYEGEIITKDELHNLAYEAKEDRVFFKILNKHINGVKTNPKGTYWVHFRPQDYQFIKFRDNVREEWMDLYESIIKNKTELSSFEQESLDYMINDIFSFICMEYGGDRYSRMKFYIKNDILRNDIANGNNKKYYDNLKELTDKRLQIEPGSPWFWVLNTLVLCNEGEWQKVAKYFTALCNSVTENGKYEDTDGVLVYLKNIINEHGGKVSVPAYPKPKGKTSGNKGSELQNMVSGAVSGYISNGSFTGKKKKSKNEDKKFLKTVYPKKKK